MPNDRDLDCNKSEFLYHSEWTQTATKMKLVDESELISLAWLSDIPLMTNDALLFTQIRSYKSPGLWKDKGHIYQCGFVAVRSLDRVATASTLSL